MNKKILYLVTVPIMTMNALMGQTFFEFNGRPVNGAARSASLAGAAAGEAYDVNTMYSNPAALSFYRHSSVIVSSMFGWTGQSFDNTVTLPPYHIDNEQVIAAGLAGSFYGEKWTQPYFAYNGIDIGYSIRLHHTLSIGTLVNFRYGNSSLSGLWATSGAIGGFYAPSPGISYGLVVDGIGVGVMYGNDGTIKYQRNLDQSIRIGSSFRFPSLIRIPYITLSLESQKFTSKSQILYRGGIETYPSQFVSLRIGIIASSLSTAGTYGVGFNFDHVRIDYALSPSRSVDRFHQISISYDWRN